MKLWIREITQEEIAKDALQLMEPSVDYGSWHYKGREELHDRDKN